MSINTVFLSCLRKGPRPLPPARIAWRIGILCAFIFILSAGRSFAQLSSCMHILDSAARLACYDDLARRETQQGSASPSQAPAAPLDPAADSGQRALKSTVLEERWELRPELKRGTFNFVAHRPVYGLVNWSSDLNEQPSSPTRTFTEQVDFDRVEAKIQLSFKTKVMQNVLGSDGDLWFGYTQLSYWQAGNSRYSSPFRETNYEPEGTFIYPLQTGVGGFRMRFAGVTLNHQSNGRSEALSRSWNRLIGEVAAEYGPWSFHLRPWTRVFAPNGDRNDNPDIEDFAGRGELIAVHRSGGHVFTLRGRHSLRSGARSHGSAQVDWAFPLAGAMNGHVQLFSGYGQNLIDYNHRQTTLGFGISFFD